jgi:adenine-specific DNA-methyltransferase
MTSDRWHIPEPLRRDMIRIARDFRKEPTPTEAILWQHLRGRQVGGAKFRRQQPIGPFVVDFCAPRLRLIIEIDGSVHDALEERDAERQRLIESLGFRFLRIPTAAIENNLGEVLHRIQIEIFQIQSKRTTA